MLNTLEKRQRAITARLAAFSGSKDTKTVRNGRTPIKGVDYFTPKEIEEMRRNISNEVITSIPQKETVKSLEIDVETVKKIVQIMHSLPENDKLEVSKGIRNAQSFIYKGTKYGMEEMMHGGSSGSATATSPVVGEVVAGSGTNFTLAHTPNTGTLAVYAIGQRLTVGVDYSLAGGTITTFNSWSAGQILADYLFT